MAKNNNSAGVGFEKQLWESANILRGNIDASEYKHVVLGLIFLKYISDIERSKHKIAIEKCGFYLPDEAKYDYLLKLPDSERSLRKR